MYKLYKDPDRDALHILPLGNIPLETHSLKKARMVKNAQMDSMIELFSDSRTGSGQIPISGLPTAFPGNKEKLDRDMTKLLSIARLDSFDVYSLRISLRELGIEVENEDLLKLSPAKQKELADDMRVFTRPLLRELYGDSDLAVDDLKDLSKILTQSDQKETAQRITRMAQRFELDLTELPKFLEEYADVFLSLAYYRNELDKLIPLMERTFRDMNMALTNRKPDNPRILMMRRVEDQIKDIMASLDERLMTFQEEFETAWESLNKTSFEDIKKRIRDNHRSIGAVLCGLAVKFSMWDRYAPEEKNSLENMFDFLRTHIWSNLDKIFAKELAGRKQLNTPIS